MTGMLCCRSGSSGRPEGCSAISGGSASTASEPSTRAATIPSGPRACGARHRRVRGGTDSVERHGVTSFSPARQPMDIAIRADGIGQVDFRGSFALALDDAETALLDEPLCCPCSSAAAFPLRSSREHGASIQCHFEPHQVSVHPFVALLPLQACKIRMEAVAVRLKNGGHAARPICMIHVHDRRGASSLPISGRGALRPHLP
jgi:hypothetical protein